MSKSFCPVPWNFQAIRANGDIRVCCQANVTKNQGVIRNSAGIAFNAGRDNLSDSRNGEIIKAIRKNMIAGAWSEECGRCKSEEEHGLNSRRIYENQQWKINFEETASKTKADGSISDSDFPLVYYDLRFGNECNFKCRMCGPTDSSGWYSDWISLTGATSFKDTSGDLEIKKVFGKWQVPAFRWPENESFWHQLEQNIDHIQQVYIAGGEPMLIERHYDFLEKCIQADCAKNITIEYNTNVSTIPTKVLNLWQQFKQIRIGASVDGIGAMQEYQRHPAKWKKTKENLIKIDGLPANVVSWLAVTVTAYNVNHLIEFMQWKLLESGFKNINSSKLRPIITHHIAHHPKHLNVRVLPDGYKKKVVGRFEDFMSWVYKENFNQDIVNQAQQITQSITSYMISASYYSDYWKEFIRYTKALDHLRKEDLKQVEPLFEEYV